MVSRIIWAVVALVLIAFLIYESVLYGWLMGAVVIVFAVLPDVALIGAFDPARPGRLHPRNVPFYNLLHRPWIALALVASGALLPFPTYARVDIGLAVAIAGLAWLAHIATDRAFGYRLRDRDGSIRMPHPSRRRQEMSQL